MSHSPEPWKVVIEPEYHCANIEDADGNSILCGDGWSETPELSRDDYERIVACVNACRGIPTEALTHSLLQPDSVALGSITGRLEAISLHNESKFTLFPTVKGEGVDCVFQRADLGEALEAVDRTVTVYGTLYFSKAKSFPVRVDVENWEVMPDPDALPTLLDLRGALKPSRLRVVEARS